jgi:hypothetical protein
MSRVQALKAELAKVVAEEAAAEAAGMTVFEWRTREHRAQMAAEAARQAQYDWGPFMAALRHLCARFDVKLSSDEWIYATHGDYHTEFYDVTP